MHEFRTGPCRDDPCGRPPRHRARLQDGTGQARPLQSPAPPPCTNSERDLVEATLAVARLGTLHDCKTGRDKPVPYNRPRHRHARIQNGTLYGRPLRSPVSAPCTTARRDGTSPSPTIARATAMHEFRTGPCTGDPCGRPSRHPARLQDGTGQARPLQSPAPPPCTNSERDLVRATLAVARLGTLHDCKTGRDKPVLHTPSRGMAQGQPPPSSTRRSRSMRLDVSQRVPPMAATSA